jgi:hypothetical protein
MHTITIKLIILLPASDKLGLYGFRANWEFKYVEGLNLGLEYDHNAGSDNKL